MSDSSKALQGVSVTCVGTLLSVREVGELLQMRKVQVRRLVRSGAFGTAERDARGHFRVRAQAVATFQRETEAGKISRRVRTWYSEMFWLYDQNTP